MADIKKVVDRLLDLADTVNDYLPMAPLSQGVIDLGRKVEGMIADLGDEIPLDQQADAKARRMVLAQKVADKARALSASLRG